MKRQAKPLKKKTASPTTSSLNLFPVTDKRPANNIKGIISTEGNEVSICISRSVARGKTLFRSPRMGEMASPGSETAADTDQIRNTVIHATQVKGGLYSRQGIDLLVRTCCPLLEAELSPLEELL